MKHRDSETPGQVPVLQTCSVMPQPNTGIIQSWRSVPCGGCGGRKGDKIRDMTQEERWQKRYEEVVGFIKTNHRNPSKHRIEEHDMLNWLKANRKVLNAGKMKAERVEKFKELLALTEQYRRKNQWE